MKYFCTCGDSVWFQQRGVEGRLTSGALVFGGSEFEEMDLEEESDDGAFPVDEATPVVDFGSHQSVTGWKKTKLKQQQKKIKPGSFGN